MTLDSLIRVDKRVRLNYTCGVLGLRRVWSNHEVEEPLSWILAILALIFAFEGLSVLRLTSLTTPTIIGVIIGFVAHELAHRSVARRYGMIAHFVAFIPGLILTFISGFLPIKIIAPGYVRISAIYGFPNPRGVLYSVAAGPLTNIVIVLGVLVLKDLTGHGMFLEPIAFVNSWIAFFNLLPIPPLDGSKILMLNRTMWLILFIISAILLILTSYL